MIHSKVNGGNIKMKVEDYEKLIRLYL
jgi:hypothetical protein